MPAPSLAGAISPVPIVSEVAEVVKERMNEGYTVLIFPEGTRSADGKIKRFHKGAFYIAEKLNLEILPIMLHGAGEAMNKKEFFLRRGIVHIKAFDKINFKTGQWGTDYSQYTKSVVRFYREEIEKLIGKKVFLDLHVVVKNRWYADKKQMEMFGYVTQ